MSTNFLQDAQKLLDSAVALTNAQRGLIALCDPVSRQPTQFVADYQFATLPSPPEEEDRFTDMQLVWKIMAILLAEGQPVTTYNMLYFEKGYFDSEHIIGRTPWNILAVPLKQADVIYGLLWCEQKFTNGFWKDDDLTRLVALVQHFQAAR